MAAQQSGTAERTVSDFVLERLAAWNVARIFGYPGDGINGVIGALRRAGDRFDFVQVAHEELAGMMATAHAKFTGELGVCLSTGGPGAIHLLNGLYDAKLDHTPVLAIVGQQAQTGLGGSVQQEVDLRALLHDVAEYIEVVSTPEQARHVIDRAVRVARGERAVAVVILPHDVQAEPAVEQPPQKHGQLHSSPEYSPARLLPHDADLRRAAAVLDAGERIAILVGQGALGARAQVQAIADSLGAGVAKALLGKSVVPDDLSYVTGSVGWLGTSASNWMMQHCDTLLMVGTSFPYSEFLPKEGQARGVQVDIAPRNLALRYPVEVALAGDAAETLDALRPLLAKKDRGAWRAQVEQQVRDTHAEAERRAMAPADPVNPQRVVWELSQRLPDECAVTADSGTSAVWLARDVAVKRGTRISLSGGLATMGCALPYALAAKLARPGELAVALVGDGAMQMSGLSALIDVAKRWTTWADPRLVVVVFNNRDLNYVTWEQRVMEGEPKYERSQSLPDIPYADYARLLGLAGMRVERPEDVIAAVEAALGANRPFVIDAVVDADVPTLPPELKKEQEDKLTKALAAGDPDAEGVLDQLAKQQIRTAKSDG